MCPVYKFEQIFEKDTLWQIVQFLLLDRITCRSGFTCMTKNKVKFSLIREHVATMHLKPGYDEIIPIY